MWEETGGFCLQLIVRWSKIAGYVHFAAILGMLLLVVNRLTGVGSAPIMSRPGVGGVAAMYSGPRGR